jgi:hypothetical protein
MARLKTVHAGEHDIQNNQVKTFNLKCRKSPFGGFKMADPEPLFFQIEADAACQMDFVFNQHDMLFVVSHSGRLMQREILQ